MQQEIIDYWLDRKAAQELKEEMQDAKAEEG